MYRDMVHSKVLKNIQVMLNGNEQFHYSFGNSPRSTVHLVPAVPEKTTLSSSTQFAEKG